MALQNAHTTESGADVRSVEQRRTERRLRTLSVLVALIIGGHLVDFLRVQMLSLVAVHAALVAAVLQVYLQCVERASRDCREIAGQQQGPGVLHWDSAPCHEFSLT